MRNISVHCNELLGPLAITRLSRFSANWELLLGALLASAHLDSYPVLRVTLKSENIYGSLTTDAPQNGIYKTQE